MKLFYNDIVDCKFTNISQILTKQHDNRIEMGPQNTLWLKCDLGH